MLVRDESGRTAQRRPSRIARRSNPVRTPRINSGRTRRTRLAPTELLRLKPDNCRVLPSDFGALNNLRMGAAKSLFLLGYPGSIGGACTEAWHLLKLFRGAGVDVTLIPTWGAPVPEWEAKCNAIGCRTINLYRVAGGIKNVPGLAGANVIGMCNEHFFAVYKELIEMECRTIWLNCMTFWFSHELTHFRRFGTPTHLVYQSQFQRTELEAQLAAAGIANDSQGHTIHGAFSVDEWKFAPRTHAPSEEFVLGKIARKDLDKWSSNLWSIMGRVQYPNRKALVMGMDENTATKLGPTPEWATWLKENAMPVQDYYKQIHCLMPVNGGARENWPRVGLEAMAAGVPVVCQKSWGWLEMIEHGVNGYLGESDEELAHWTATLAWNEERRLRIIRNAREKLVDELADWATLWAKWEKVLA